MAVVETLHPDDWLAAMNIAHARVAAEQRFERVGHALHLLRTGVIDAGGVFVARETGSIVGVQVCVPLAGAASLFWLPSADNEVADMLVQAGIDWLRSIGCKMAQALAGPDEIALANPLLRHGFQAITHLRHMGHDLIEIPAAPAAGLRFECSSVAPPALFADTLERTYDGTLDCPEMNGKRTIDEVLAGHRGQGTFHPDMWWLVYQNADPMGVVVLSEMPNGWTWELAYLGIVPAFRGRGLGRPLTLHALHALRARGALRLVLAVDERNTPALRLYESLGFVETETNVAFLFFL